MRLHVWFAGLLLLVLTTQAGRFATELRAGEPPDLASLVAGMGLKPVGETADGVVLAMAPDCPHPVLLASFGFNGLNDMAARTLRARGAVQTVYLGKVMQSPSLPLLLLRAGIVSVLHAAGLRAAPVAQSIVQYIVPADCPALARRDWTALSPW